MLYGTKNRFEIVVEDPIFKFCASSSFTFSASLQDMENSNQTEGCSNIAPGTAPKVSLSRNFTRKAVVESNHSKLPDQGVRAAENETVLDQPVRGFTSKIDNPQVYKFSLLYYMIHSRYK